MADLRKVTIVNGIEVKFSEFMQKYIIFIPKGNGKSVMHSFEEPGDAVGFIETNVPKPVTTSDKGSVNQKKYWWNEDD